MKYERERERARKTKKKNEKEKRNRNQERTFFFSSLNSSQMQVESRGERKKRVVGEREKREWGKETEGYIIRVIYELGMPITIVMYVYIEG